jgi:branched-chain amino acid transport system substrate-binding protein
LLDDATDPTHAVQNARKLISEEKVDVILGPNLISTAMAIADIAHDEQVPMVSVAPLDVSGDKRSTVFRSEPSASLMVRRIVQDMEAKGLKRVAFIGFADSWGELLLKSLTTEGDGKIEIVDGEQARCGFRRWLGHPGGDAPDHPAPAWLQGNDLPVARRDLERVSARRGA